MVLASALTSASKVCPRPRPQRFVLGLGFGLKKLSSFNITGNRYQGYRNQESLNKEGNATSFKNHFMDDERIRSVHVSTNPEWYQEG